MEYSVVVNNFGIVHVSGDEAALAKFKQAQELVQLLIEDDSSNNEAWAELRLPSGEPIARFDKNGMSECGAIRGM